MNFSNKRKTLRLIDEALRWFLNERLDFFKQISSDRSMEAMLKAELYEHLKSLFGDGNVFLEWPSGVGTKKFDVYIRNIQNSQYAYVEFKMFYRKGELEYRNDFDKLRTHLKIDKNSIAMLVHFNFIFNKNKPNHILLESFKNSLITSRYFRKLSYIRTKGSTKHFYRLVFWTK